MADENPPVTALPPIAGFWRRAAAKLVDTLGLFLVLGVIVDAPVFGFPFDPLGDISSSTRAGILALLLAAYYTVLEARGWQASLGKRLFGLRVIGRRGGSPGWARALMRSWPFWLPLIALSRPIPYAILTTLGLLAVVAAGFTAHRQGLHDLMARTLVVRIPSRQA